MLDPKPRHSNHMRKVIGKVSIISSQAGNKLGTNDDIPVSVPNEASNQLLTFLYPRYRLSTIGEIPGEFYTVLYFRIMCTHFRDRHA